MQYSKPMYPLYIDLEGQTTAVVGAGSVAERKIETLLSYGADVRVVAPEATPAIRALAESGSLAWIRRRYEEGDVGDAFVVICATDDRETNERVYREAEANGRLVNVVDVPDLCNFYVPSVVRRGPLQIAISTAGAAPTVAKQIRRELQAAYGEEWGSYVSLLGEVRTLVLARIAGGEEAHKPLFSALAAAGLLERIAAGETLDAEGVYREIVEPLVGQAAAQSGAGRPAAAGPVGGGRA